MINRYSVRTYLSGLLIGGTVGAVAGLLLAPRSGDKTRAILRDRAMEIRDQGMEKVTSTQARVAEVINDVRDRASDAIQTGKERVAQLQQ